MYTNHTIAVLVAQDKQRDMLAAAERERRVRQVRQPRRPSQLASRRGRRGWQLPWPLRPQAVS
ncbi:MAG: hypothetical protein WBH47_24020 [Streptosporangiaceae bacterium]